MGETAESDSHAAGLSPDPAGEASLVTDLQERIEEEIVVGTSAVQHTAEHDSMATEPTEVIEAGSAGPSHGEASGPQVQSSNKKTTSAQGRNILRRRKRNARKHQAKI
ncbi:hypothetical protein CMQ_4028 [Grosmannia clavigera kw1407]|uniref:Uncharacterized protein n=1 Tax=Grosmannia clavigera (strain kw1407 / UAMH 11150) TaxID=655863 RepID=F0X9L7_GROCL|nr:uncharacterized protein CMQ_4028 [Grosmannia clavigera kw1407]EFX05959.1 hypothetical protein CMQ_4028 [Grosmannia clavigera kw1407]